MSIWGKPVMMGGSGGGGGQTYNITAKRILSASDLCFEAEFFDITSNEQGISIVNYPLNREGLYSPSDSCIFADLENANHDQVIYAVIKSLTTGGNYQGVGSNYGSSGGNAPNIYTNSSTWQTSVYGSDTSTGITSTVYHVLSISINASTKKCDYYIDGVSYGTKSFNNCGRYPSIGGGTINGSGVVSTSEMRVLFGAIAAEYHDSATVTANHQILLAAYSDYIGT